MTRKPNPIIKGIYVLTDTQTSKGRSHVEICKAALEGGARLIQFRAKDMETAEAVLVARDLVAHCRRYEASLIVNDRVDIALAAGADGVHLGPGDMEPGDSRALLGERAIIGVSVATVAEGVAAARHASYFGVGAIFGSSTKLDAGDAVGPDRLREIKVAFPSMPIVAIGGINERNIHLIRETGVDAAAVISAVTSTGDMTAATRSLIALWQS